MIYPNTSVKNVNRMAKKPMHVIGGYKGKKPMHVIGGYKGKEGNFYNQKYLLLFALLIY